MTPPSSPSPHGGRFTVSSLLIFFASALAACSISASADVGPSANPADAGPEPPKSDTPSDAGVETNPAVDPNYASDPLNCGTKGHDCLGGSCAKGVCQPVGVSKDGVFTNGPWASGSDVYVAGEVALGSDLLWKFPANGGAGTSLESTAFQNFDDHLLLLGHETYALPAAGNTLVGNYDYSSNNVTQAGILSIDLGSGKVTKLIDTPLDMMQRGAPFAVDATHLYWAEDSGLKRRPIGGGDTENLSTPTIEYPIVAMASDADALYLGAEYDVFRYKKSDGSVTNVLQTLYRVTHVAVDAQNVYATDTGDTGCTDTNSFGSVWSALKTATSSAATEKLVTGTHIVSLTAGNGRAFWFDNCTGTVHGTPPTKGKDEILWKAGGADCCAIVAKATNVLYWRSSNKLWKLAD